MQRNNAYQNRPSCQDVARTLNVPRQKHVETECASIPARSSTHAPEAPSVWHKVTRLFALVRSVWWVIRSRTATANQSLRLNVPWTRNAQAIGPVSTKNARIRVPKETHAQEMPSVALCTIGHSACALEDGEAIQSYSASDRNVKPIAIVRTIRLVTTRSA